MGKDYVALADCYARDVVAGKIDACRWVKLACQRQINDRKRKDKDWPWRWDKAKASRVCAFIELLPHVEGRWRTVTVDLEPWQCFILTTIFGWVGKRDGMRRFRKALIVIPRKAGKTLMAAGVALYLLMGDSEPGAQIVSAATTRDQAKLAWTVAHKQVTRTPELKTHFNVEALAHSILIEGEGSTFKPLSRDVDSLEGLNISGAVIDELHAHPNRELFDVIDEATGARQQPLIFIISTEGDNDSGIFSEQVKYAQDVMEGTHGDDTYFGIYYTIDKGDDWMAPASWYKANPNLGVSVLLKDMEARCSQAARNPSSQSSFLTKRLNVRVGAADSYFNMLAWDRLCKDTNLKIEDFYGEPCFVTLDLASKSDLAARVMIFRRVQHYYVFSRCYLPEDAIERGQPNYDRYRGWMRAGHLVVTPGKIIDYEFIERDLLEDAKQFRFKRVGYDPYQATQFVTRMEKQGLKMVEVPATVLQFSDPMKEMAALIISGRLRHNGDPVLSWTVGNVIAKVDAKENVYPRKAREENKIDAAVATIAGMNLWSREKNVQSIYESRGLLTL